MMCRAIVVQIGSQPVSKRQTQRRIKSAGQKFLTLVKSLLVCLECQSITTRHN